MWRCVNCGEESEDSFDVCWNCGTASDGTPNPYFHREPSEKMVALEPDLPSPSGPLTHAELGSLVCRCMAIWILLNALQGLGNIVLFVFLLISLGEIESLAAGVAGLPIGQLLVGTILWIKSEPIGRRMVLRPNAALHILRSNLRAVLPLVIVIIGVLQVTRQVTYFVRLTVYLIGFRDVFFDAWQSVEFQQDFWPTVVNVAIGLWLIFDARRIVRRITGRKPLRVSQEGDAAAA